MEGIPGKPGSPGRCPPRDVVKCPDKDSEQVIMTLAENFKASLHGIRTSTVCIIVPAMVGFAAIRLLQAFRRGYYSGRKENGVDLVDPS